LNLPRPPRHRRRRLYATPRLDRLGEINHNDGGRGLYFLDPAGSTMEIITRPYGGGPS